MSRSICEWLAIGIACGLITRVVRQLGFYAVVQFPSFSHIMCLIGSKEPFVYSLSTVHIKISVRIIQVSVQ